MLKIILLKIYLQDYIPYINNLMFTWLLIN